MFGSLWWKPCRQIYGQFPSTAGRITKLTFWGSKLKFLGSAVCFLTFPSSRPDIFALKITAYGQRFLIFPNKWCDQSSWAYVWANHARKHIMHYLRMRACTLLPCNGASNGQCGMPIEGMLIVRNSTVCLSSSCFVSNVSICLSYFAFYCLSYLNACFFLSS